MKIAFRTAALTFLAAAAAGWAFALTLGSRQFVCPACGTEFTSVIAYSGTQYGIRLDFRAAGPIYSPSPIRQCPSCRFAYSDEWLRNGLPPDAAGLQTLTASPEFTSIPDDAPPYFYLAKIREIEEAPAEEVMFAYLQASWQAEGPDPGCGASFPDLVRNKAMMELSLREALRVYETTPFPEGKGPDTETMYLALGVELNRRLGHFGEAESRLSTFKRALFRILLSPESGHLPKILHAFITQQEAAIAEEDTLPRNLVLD